MTRLNHTQWARSTFIDNRWSHSIVVFREARGVGRRNRDARRREMGPDTVNFQKVHGFPQNIWAELITFRSLAAIMEVCRSVGLNKDERCQVNVV